MFSGGVNSTRPSEVVNTNPLVVFKTTPYNNCMLALIVYNLLHEGPCRVDENPAPNETRANNTCIDSAATHTPTHANTH